MDRTIFPISRDSIYSDIADKPAAGSPRLGSTTRAAETGVGCETEEGRCTVLVGSLAVVAKPGLLLLTGLTLNEGTVSNIPTLGSLGRSALHPGPKASPKEVWYIVFGKHPE